MTPGMAHAKGEILTNVRKKNKIKIKRYAFYNFFSKSITHAIRLMS
jgi:hypothetical protein